MKVLSEARWGIEAKYSGGPLHLNARAESIDQKFRKDFEGRRCLVLADSFYEWKHPEKKPFRAFLKGEEMFAFAGIYEEDERRSCCIITTPSNGLISPVHNRMPAILPIGKERAWLEMGAAEAKAMLKPYPAEKMTIYEVSRKVNSAKNDSPNVLKAKTTKGTLLEYMK